MTTGDLAVSRHVSCLGGEALSHADVLNSLIFKAGVAATAEDLITAFYADDFGRLDWLADYVLDRGLLDIADFVDEPELAEEPMFNKKDMAVGSGDALYDA